MLHGDFLGIDPVLDGQMLDINVARPFSRDTVVDHIDSRHVVFVKWSKAMLWVSIFEKDGTNIINFKQRVLKRNYKITTR